jgi:hypothetical protein
MKTPRKIASVVLVGLTFGAAGALAADDPTAASIAALQASVGNVPIDVDEVRITHDGVACIEYRVRGNPGAPARGHAVVRGKDVLRVPSQLGGGSTQEFEKAWNEHCLGPHGGMASDQ